MNLLREMVSGHRQRLQEGNFNLDLTYITPKVIAMSYPGNDILTKMYRNSITDVVNYLDSKHQDHWKIYNMSNFVYDYSVFGFRVVDAKWEDHHSPTLSTLFDMCNSMYEYLSFS